MANGSSMGQTKAPALKSRNLFLSFELTYHAKIKIGCTSYR